MAITIVDRPEALSERSYDLDEGADPLVIDSESARLLRQEMERYCKGTITGRSFLIAGHRGSGKTTLVNSAFLETWKKRERGTQMLRPVYVPLHGPALFPDALLVDGATGAVAEPGAGDEGDEEAGGGSASPNVSDGEADATVDVPASKKKGPRESEAERALKQITLGLHRTVATEFIHRYHRYVKLDKGDRPAAVERAMSELAATLESELYDMAPAARLRQLWELASALESGVLFDNGAPRVSTRDEIRGAQGMRELVALSSVVDAYRRISGEARAQLAGRDKSMMKEARQADLSPDAKSLVAPVTAVLTGGLSALGTGLATNSALQAALGGIGGAFIAGSVFKWSSMRTRERLQTREDQFIFDLSVSTLDRVLPVLIARLRAAGLAPIFVVDELDKVRDLDTRILKLVHHLKKLVAENAFFCFITDRDYYEGLEREISTHAYGVQHSYFSQRVLVTFNVSDFDVYLQKRLAAPPDPTLTVPNAPPQAPAAGTPANAAPASSDDYPDWIVLRWLLRYASRLHALDLHRELAKLRNEKEAVSYAPGEVRTATRHRCDLTMQVAIELTLDRPDVRNWIADSPDSRQALYDALYYLPRLQEQGGATIDLESDAGKETFARYLVRRTNTEHPEREDQLVTLRLASEEFEFLWEQLQAMAQLLLDHGPLFEPTMSNFWAVVAEWDEYREKTSMGRLRTEVRDALLLGKDVSVLTGELGALRWRYKRSGDLRQVMAAEAAASVVPPPPVDAGATVPPAVPQAVVPPAVVPSAEPAASEPPQGGVDRGGAAVLPPAATRGGKRDAAPAAEQAPPPAPPPTPSVPEWRSDLQFIRAYIASASVPPGTPAAVYDFALASLGELANTYGLIPTTPAWTRVDAAMRRLDSSVDQPQMRRDLAEDARMVHEYRRVLEKSQPQIALGYACAIVIAKGLNEIGQTTSVADAIAGLARSLRLPQLDADAVLTQLQRTAGELVELQLTGWSELHYALKEVTSHANPLELVQTVARAVKEAPATTIDRRSAMLTRAWASLRTRIEQWITRREVTSASAAEILCQSANIGPARFLRTHIDQATVREWSRAMMDGLRLNTSAPPPDRVAAPWLAAMAGAALGVQQALGEGVLGELIRWSTAHEGTQDVDAQAEMSFWFAVIVAQVHGRLLLLVSEEEQGSLSASWLPVPDFCVLHLRREDVRIIMAMELGRLLLKSTLQQFIVAVEAGTRGGRAERYLEEMRERFSHPSAQFVIISREPLRLKGIVNVPSPRSAEEVFAIVASGTPRNMS